MLKSFSFFVQAEAANMGTGKVFTKTPFDLKSYYSKWGFCYACMDLTLGINLIGVDRRTMQFIILAGMSRSFNIGWHINPEKRVHRGIPRIINQDRRGHPKEEEEPC